METSKPIRILIVDDHEMVRRSLTLSLSLFPDLTIVGEASNGFEALKAYHLERPDVILMDLRMPQMDGVTATRKILQRNTGVKIIALTTNCDNGMVKEFIKAGAERCLLKNITVDELAANIRSIYT